MFELWDANVSWVEIVHDSSSVAPLQAPKEGKIAGVFTRRRHVRDDLESWAVRLDAVVQMEDVRSPPGTGRRSNRSWRWRNSVNIVEPYQTTPSSP